MNTKTKIMAALERAQRQPLLESEMEEIADELVEELQPIQDPSELIVEVDGHGDIRLTDYIWTKYGRYFFDSHHIRLIKPNGEAVLDNKHELKNQE